VARLLAKRLGRKLYGIDDLIVEEAGRSIPEIVQQLGWPGFRDLELKIVEQVTRMAQDEVIDCGGGVVLDDRNVNHLRQNGKMVLLTASLNTILHRIRRDSNRPPLKEGLSFEEEQRQILDERREKYEKSSDLILDTTHRSPQEIVRQIVAHGKKNRWI